MFVCPHCQKELKKKKSLEAHIARFHSEHTDQGDQPAREFDLAENEEKDQDQQYHCIGCGKDITKDQNPCPHCGAELDWSARK